MSSFTTVIITKYFYSIKRTLLRVIYVMNLIDKILLLLLILLQGNKYILL